MRKRSGALHSDSQEEFRLLAQYAHQKNGYFYDESLHKQITDKLKSKIKRVNSLQHNPNSAHILQGFDYAVHDLQKQEEMQQLQAQNQSVLINFVIICPSQFTMRRKLLELWPDNSQSDTQPHPPRDIDLYIVNTRDIHHHNHCFKFWLIEPQNVDNPLCNSYLKRARKIINFSDCPGRGQRWPEQQAKGVLFSMVSSFID